MLKINLKNLNLSGFSLKDIDFQVKKGQILLLAGLNGAGKTTLLKTLAGVYPVKPENLIYQNRPLSASLVEYIPPSLQTGLSLGVQSFLETCQNRLFLSPETRERILRAAQFLKITHLLDHDLSRLSSGETVKVLLAKALLSKKPIILWDEPTSFLDLRYQRFLQKALLRLKSKKTWILSSHHYAWARPLTDTFVGLRQGTQVFVSSTLTRQELKKLLI